MRSHSWLVAAGSALLSACSSSALLNDSDDSKLEDPSNEQSSLKGESEHGEREKPSRQRLPTGQYITPTILPGSVQLDLNPGFAAYPDWAAGNAARSQLSPDGKTLAVLTAGENSLVKADGTVDTAATTQFIFLYDVSGKNKRSPKLSQVLQPTNSYVGLVFSPDGQTLYATGGADDRVYVYSKSGGSWVAASPIALNHGDVGIGAGVRPNAAGLGLSKDGTTLVVANNYNDSISVVDTATGTLRYDHDLRPFAPGNEGVAGGVGGTFPFAVAIKKNTIAYVSSARDREVVVVDISSPTAGRLVKRIKLDGNALGLTLDADEKALYVAQDNADQVAVIDTASNEVVAKIDARAPRGLLPGDEAWLEKDAKGDRWSKKKPARHTGAGTFAVTLSPDGKKLYAVNAAANSIAVVDIDKRWGRGRGPSSYRYEVIGLLPTAYEPHDITFSADNTWAYIINGKSVTTPNPLYPTSTANQYQFQLERASLVAQPVVTDERALEALTEQVAENNFYDRVSARDKAVFAFLRKRIKHVVYIIKENRTFDQMLGDLTNGANADPSLTQFPRPITPSLHKLATEFVTLDNFMDAGDGSMDGWSWGLQGRVTNTEALTQQINYSFIDRGLSYESEGTNRNLPVQWPTVAERDAVSGPAGTTNYSAATSSLPGGAINALAGTGDHALSDAPFAEQGGYIYQAVLAAGGTVRSYGTLANNVGSIGTIASPIIDPYAAGEVQVAELPPFLAPHTDVYFRAYDQAYPDLWKYKEWKREFDQFVANGNLPNLTVMGLGHDHMGSFGSALAGVNTPELQQADNDLSTGLIVQAVANSPYADETLIIVTEDDCQDGPDHVASHRATTYVVGPYVKKGAVISTHYNQVNVIRTIEDVLGTEHLNLNTAFQAPMTDVFDIKSSREWTFQAEASTILQGTELTTQIAEFGVPYAPGASLRSSHDAAYWQDATSDMDFSLPDQVPTAKFNKLLWKGIKGDRPYPELKNRLSLQTQPELDDAPELDRAQRD